MSKNSIFIQIAAYRDPELVPTLNSLFDNAEFPDNLTVCVAWQHSIEDEWDPTIKDGKKTKGLKY